MRKTLATFAAATIALVGCSGDSEESESTTTAAPTTAAEDAATWSGPTMDGDTVTITEGGDTSFTDGLPGPIWSIDQAAGDCVSLEVEADQWESSQDSPGSPELIERMSAYERYARDAMAAAGC